MEDNTILTPRERTALLKQRAADVRAKLPLTYWRPHFIKANPGYKGREQLLSNVITGRSSDEQLLTLIENWIDSYNNSK